jgi:hypothetical protein
MTPNQWLLFVGIPALCAIVALIADWRRTARRRRIGETISRHVDVSGTLLHEEPPDLAISPSDPQSGSPQSKAEQTDPLEELARVIRFTRSGGAEEGAGEKPMGGAR